MLSTNENEKLTAVGKGTPMGELMRRYWHPIAASAELGERPTKPVRLLGEDLVHGSSELGDVVGRVCGRQESHLIGRGRERDASL